MANGVLFAVVSPPSFKLQAEMRCWGLLNQFPPFRYFPCFSFRIIETVWLPTGNHIHIWLVWLQLRCNHTCQIWMWFNLTKYLTDTFAWSEILRGNWWTKLYWSPPKTSTSSPVMSKLSHHPSETNNIFRESSYFCFWTGKMSIGLTIFCTCESFVLTVFYMTAPQV